MTLKLQIISMEIGAARRFFSRD